MLQLNLHAYMLVREPTSVQADYIDASASDVHLQLIDIVPMNDYLGGSGRSRAVCHATSIWEDPMMGWRYTFHQLRPSPEDVLLMAAIRVWGSDRVCKHQDMHSMILALLCNAAQSTGLNIHLPALMAAMR